MTDMQLADANTDPLPVEEAPKLTPQEMYLAAIADEIANDPMNLGYAGKTADEQADLLNNPWYQMVPQQMTSRAAMLIDGIPFAPNAVSPDDLSQAAPLIEQAVAAVQERLKLIR